MRSLFNIFAVILMLLFVSCDKNEHIGSIATDGRIDVILKSADFENIGTTKSIDQLPDEGVDADYRVKDYWILQYASDGSFIDNAKYIEVVEGEDYKTPVVLPEGDNKYYCLFIANTHNPNLDAEFEPYKGSLASMAKFYRTISTLDDTYNIDEQDLVMSGITQLASTDTQLYCKLYRNIAKVTVQLTNSEASELTIKSINIRNVPGGALYTDRILDETSLPGVSNATAPFPDIYSFPYIDYELDNISVSENSTESFVWYLPRNLKGVVNEATTADLKNKYAPEMATYVEIYATTNDSNEPLRYRFYIGNNATNDFNVEPNKHYTLPITFIDKGSVLDSRVFDYGVIKLSGNSNCYIINPLPIDEQTIYQLPINRINQFWSSSDAQSGVDNTISSETEWVAEVIWQDQSSRVLNFLDGNGASADSFTATGPNASINFEVLKGAKGNVLVGVRKSGDTKYLWSWHLWITDYNPDESYNMPWVDNKYVYYVTGGQVHRYAGNYWEVNCVNKYMMDRNLGALSTNRADGLEMTGGFIYQYGRKDPFPYYGWTIYDINGQPISYNKGTDSDCINKILEKAPIYESVYWPYNFYAKSGDWALNNQHASISYSWNGPSNEKSMFDPCPEGWMIPKNEVWSNFMGASNTEANRNSNSIMRNSNSAGVEFYIDAPYGEDHKEYNVAYFPAMGIRRVQEGIGENHKLRGYVHSTQAKISSANTISLDFVLKSGEVVEISTTSGSSKSKGLSVRCIKENAVESGGEQTQGGEVYEQEAL